jgi:hypothetical protein
MSGAMGKFKGLSWARKKIVVRGKSELELPSRNTQIHGDLGWQGLFFLRRKKHEKAVSILCYLLNLHRE